MEPIDLARALPIQPAILLVCPRCGMGYWDWYGRYLLWSDPHEPHCRQCWHGQGIHSRLEPTEETGGEL